jgi:hypothetical protein
VSQRARRLEVRDEDREGLLVPVLLPAEVLDGGRAPRVAGEVIAAEALHGGDRPRVESARDEAERVVSRRERLAPGVGRAEARSTGRARDGLGVEAAVGRVLVFRPAGRAEREPGHGRALAVVGGARDDREARTAARAVGEGIPVAPVGRVEDLAEAVVAGRDVGRDEDARGSGRGARLDPEARGVVPERTRLPGHVRDPGERRRVAPELEHELLE